MQTQLSSLVLVSFRWLTLSSGLFQLLVRMQGATSATQIAARCVLHGSSDAATLMRATIPPHPCFLSHRSQHASRPGPPRASSCSSCCSCFSPPSSPSRSLTPFRRSFTIQQRSPNFSRGSFQHRAPSSSPTCGARAHISYSEALLQSSLDSRDNSTHSTFPARCTLCTLSTCRQQVLNSILVTSVLEVLQILQLIHCFFAFLSTLAYRRARCTALLV